MSLGDAFKERVVFERSELMKDLLAFKWARDRIQHRVLESQGEERFQTLVEWSGTSAVMGSLDLCIHAMERQLEEMRELVNRVETEDG